MRIISYNVNGIRAAIKKGFIDWLKTDPADIVCVQETKAVQGDVDAKLLMPWAIINTGSVHKKG
jgi:exodeoxyribonuclease-3